VVVEEEDI